MTPGEKKQRAEEGGKNQCRGGGWGRSAGTQIDSSDDKKISRLEGSISKGNLRPRGSGEVRRGGRKQEGVSRKTSECVH